MIFLGWASGESGTHAGDSSAWSHSRAIAGGDMGSTVRFGVTPPGAPTASFHLLAFMKGHLAFECQLGALGFGYPWQGCEVQGGWGHPYGVAWP